MPHDIWHAHSDLDWYESVGQSDEPPAGADEIDIRLERRYRDLNKLWRLFNAAPSEVMAAEYARRIAVINREIDDIEEDLAAACERDDRRDFGWSRGV